MHVIVILRTRQSGGTTLGWRNAPIQALAKMRDDQSPSRRATRQRQIQVEHLGDRLGQGGCAAPAAVGKDPNALGMQRCGGRDRLHGMGSQVERRGSRFRHSPPRLELANRRPGTFGIPVRHRITGR
jgi:hypothetical protein